jgi:hypothetical protein
VPKRRPANVPEDATEVLGSWYQGRVTTRPARGGGGTWIVCDGFVREWDAKGVLQREGEYADGEATMLRTFHPDGSLCREIHYQGRGMARTEHGVCVWQRYAKAPKQNFPINEKPEVWRLEETFVAGKRKKVRRLTREQCEPAAAATPPARPPSPRSDRSRKAPRRARS